MKILQADMRQLHQIGEAKPSQYLVVESQVYGQDDDLIFHLACSNVIAEQLKFSFFLKEIPDTGRTPGFYQNLGGSGIYKPNSIPPLFFPTHITDVLKTKKEAKLSFIGSTWLEIFLSLPANYDGLKETLGVFEQTLEISVSANVSAQNEHSNI